jgi:hypothetical protein
LFISLTLFSFLVNKNLFAFTNQNYQDILVKKYTRCKLTKENVYLTKKQVNKIKQKINEHASALILRYNNPCNKSRIYIDSNVVRTLNQTVITEVQNNKVLFLKIASFMEPKEYLPPQKWLDQFLETPYEVDTLTGATISENSIKKLVRKYLVIDNISHDKNRKKNI